MVGFAGELLLATVGFDVPMSDRATVGIGVSHTNGDGTLGDDTTDVSLFSVHPYLRWQLSPRTQVWGQTGLGNGNLQVRDADGDVTLDEDFQVTFVTAGSSSELPTQVIEGSGRYLLVHHESSKRQWGASALVSVDAGTVGHGLAFSLRPSYGISDSQGVDIWRDRLPTEKSNEAALQVAATLSYGTGALGGRAIATPYGSYGLGKAGRHTLREGLRVRLASEGMHVDSYIEQQSGGGERRA